MADTIIVGGGAAGMMAAVAADDSGDRVCLIEKNEKLGKKLFITGKGRCNVTNAADMDTLFESVCSNRKFLYSAFYDFDNRAVMDFLEQAGCALKTERGERVFPVSDHSSDVIGAFARELKKRNVKILFNTEVSGLIVSGDDGTEKPRITGVRLAGDKASGGSGVEGVEASEGGSGSKGAGASGHGAVLAAEKVIVCTGGASYPSTGSTGDGYRFAKQTGHRVVQPQPALVPFDIKEPWCTELMGLSLKNVSVRMVCGNKELYRGFGEMLFTHFGVSGPLILSASSFYRQVPPGSAGSEASRKGKKDSGAPGDTMLYIDLKPALDEEQLDSRLLRDFEENKNRQFKNALNALFPVKLIPVMVALSGIDPDKKVNEITRQERRDFGRLIKNLPFTVAGTRGFAEAVITRGGVSVKDINPSTMESKKVDGLYFAGEVLDLDALTGGFNLQIAWSTGHLAGKS